MVTNLRVRWNDTEISIQSNFINCDYEITIHILHLQIYTYYSFKNLFPIIIPTKVKDPIITATNTVSATDANGSPAIPVNME
jgi:hypothetical protein